MTFHVDFAGPAGRYLSRLDGPTQARIATPLRAHAEDPFGVNTKALHGRPERSPRIGTWRVLYRVDLAARVGTITAIAPRGQAYRQR